MTPEEYNDKLIELHGLVSGNLTADTILPAGVELLSAIKTRIEIEGKDSTDAPIGQYSTKPFYASPNQFIKGGFTPMGKQGAKGSKTIVTSQILSMQKVTRQTNAGFIMGRQLAPIKNKKNKKESQVKNDYSQYKTMYLKEGYRELREIQGLQIEKINFKYSGDLLESYQTQLISLYVVLGLTEELSVKKKEGLEKKFGPVLYATEKEMDDYKRRATYLLNRITRSVITGENVTAEID